MRKMAADDRMKNSVGPERVIVVVDSESWWQISRDVCLMGGRIDC